MPPSSGSTADLYELLLINLVGAAAWLPGWQHMHGASVCQTGLHSAMVLLHCIDSIVPGIESRPVPALQCSPTQRPRPHADVTITLSNEAVDAAHAAAVASSQPCRPGLGMGTALLCLQACSNCQ
jgi:hypothetical protein